MKRSSATLSLLAAALLSACDDASTPTTPAPPESPTRSLLDSLFAPPTAAETTAVAALWKTRTAASVDARFEDSGSMALQLPAMDLGAAALFGIPAAWFDPDTGVVRVVSHTVDGFRHEGALLTGSRTASLPIVVFAHGGDDGLDTLQWRTIAQALKPLRDSVALLAPAFRAEGLGFLSRPVSAAPPSPWDADVDDLRALVRAAASLDDRLDTTRVCVVGYSRGGGVALLAAARDPLFKAVATVAAPTAFQGPWARRLADSILAGREPDLPGMDFLADSVLLPLEAGRITMAAARSQLLRRSATTWVRRLPEAARFHHGYADLTVPSDELVRLQAALQAIGRSPTTHYWPNLNHTTVVPWALGEIVPFVRAQLLD